MHPPLFPANCEHVSAKDSIQFCNADLLTDVCSLFGQFFRFPEIARRMQRIVLKTAAM
jgi:hypothetical protein